MKGLASKADFVAALRTVADMIEGQPAVMHEPDEVRPIVDFAKLWGLEPKALLKAAKRLGVAFRLGRHWAARRSDLTGPLVERLRAEDAARPPRSTRAVEAATHAGAYASLVEATRRGGKRRAA